MLEIKENEFANFDVINSITGDVIAGPFLHPEGAAKFIENQEKHFDMVNSYRGFAVPTWEDKNTDTDPDWYPVADKTIGE